MRTFLIGCVLGLLCTLAEAAPACVPLVYGTQVGDAYGKRTNEGRYLHFYCKAGDKITAEGLACVHGTCLPVGSFFERLDGLKQQADPVAAVKDAWDASFPQDSCRTSTGTLKTVCDAMFLSMRENWPVAATPAPAYKVKPNGLILTRPAYLLTNGVRGTKEVARAPVGAACDITKPTLPSGADLWAEFGTPGVVALCAK